MTVKQVSELSGELVAAPAQVEVPFAPGFDLEKLKQTDPDPRFATVKIKPGRGNGGNGPNYGPNILRDLARQINEKRPAGYRGHQDESRVHWEWREPVTAWVGAVFDEQEQALYVKGYVPPTAQELRTQLALAETGADVVNSVSIWGMRDVKGDEVLSYELWSLDWTPKGRAGMETELVSVSGEQQKEAQVERSEVIKSLKPEELPDALKDHFRNEGKALAAPELESYTKAIGEMRVILELDEKTDTAAVISKVSELVAADKAAELEAKVREKVEADIAGELMRAAVIERVISRLKPGADDKTITGEIAAAKELPHVKALGGQRIPTVLGVAPSSSSDGSKRQGTQWF